MPLPVKERTWVFRNNVAIASTSEGMSSITTLWNIKEMLVANGCTVVGSCDGTTYGMDGVDRWVTPPLDHLTTNNVREWVVLQFPSGRQILLHARPLTNLSYTYTGANNGALSSTGFSGGSISVTPSASDAMILYDSGTTTTSVFIPSNVSSDFVFHGMYSVADEALRTFVCVGGAVKSVAIIEPVADPTVSKVNTKVFHLFPDGYFVQSYASLHNGAWVDGGRRANVLTHMGYINNASTAPNVQMYKLQYLGMDELTDEWPMYPIGITSTNVGYRGFWGRLKDIYVTPQVPTLIAGTTFPADGSRQWIHTGGDMALPWDGSVPLVA